MPEINSDSVAQDQIKAFIERIERLEEEKAAIAGDIKEVYAEAKGNGFDTKVLRKIISIRKQDANDRMEMEAHVPITAKQFVHDDFVVLAFTTQTDLNEVSIYLPKHMQACVSMIVEAFN